MIDEEATFEKYGYRSTDLTPKSNKKVVAICDGCGKIRYLDKCSCSDLCISCGQKGENNSNWNGGWITVICQHCGKEYTRKPSITSEGRFCSQECYHAATSGENHYNWKGGEITVICQQCGKEYTRKPSVSSESRFCSFECMGEWMSKNRCGEDNSNWQGGEVLYVCKQCGKLFYHKKGRNPIFCSKGCLGEWLSENRSGENSPRWRGGGVAYCEKFNEKFKESVRNKYDRKCFICGKDEERNGRKMAVHHVSYDRKCLCDGVECYFVPLCVSCHSRTNSNRVFWERALTYAIWFDDEECDCIEPKPLLYFGDNCNV